MKKLLFLLLVPVMSISQRCPTAPCTAYQKLPIMDVNGFNNNKGSKCIQGAGDVGTNLNFNQWDYLSFKEVTRVHQTINASESQKQKVYITGSTIIDRYTVDKDDTMFVLMGVPNILDAVPNNHGGNVIVVPQDGYITIEGNNYYGGDYFQEQGNPTNRIKIIECSLYVLSIRDNPQRPTIPDNQRMHFKVTEVFTGATYERFCTLVELKKQLTVGTYVLMAGNYVLKIKKI